MTASVVIPTYNAAAFLPRALASVFAQTLPPAEIVVADDGSSDDTVALAERFAAAAPVPVRVVLSPRNSGGPAAPLNAGIAAARGWLIATLDQDDEFRPDKLAHSAAAFAAAPDLGLVFGRTELAGSRNQLLAWHDRLEATVRALPHVEAAAGVWRLGRRAAYSALVTDRCLAKTCSNMVFPKAVWAAVGGFDARLRAVCDYRFLQQVAARYDLGFVDAPLARWNQHVEGLTVAAGPRHVQRELLAVRRRFDRTLLDNTRRAELAELICTDEWELAYSARQAGEYRRAAAYLARSAARGRGGLAVWAALLKLVPHWAAQLLRRRPR